MEVALVTRVYLTRSIEQTRTVGRSSEAKLRALTSAATRLQSTTRPPEASSTSINGAAPGKKPAPADGGAASSSALTKDVLDGLDAALPGGVLSVVTASGNEYEPKQTFQRPIVIGYRAVRYKVNDSIDNPGNQSAGKGN